MIGSAQLDARIRSLGIDMVMSRSEGAHERVALLSRRGEEYAVCRFHLLLGVVMTPRYRDLTPIEGSSLLSAAITERGLDEVLDWTDRQTAISRYQELASGKTPTAPPIAAVPTC